MSITGASNYASLDEAWGPIWGGSGPVTSNIYQDPAYQRQVLNSSASFGIVPRDPQVLDAGTVKEYVAQLYRDSGPVAVQALLPAEFLQYTKSRQSRRVRFIDEEAESESGIFSGLGLGLGLGSDDELLFFALIASFALLVMSDGV